MDYQQPFRPQPNVHLPLNHFNDETAEAAYAETEREAMASSMLDTPDLHDPPKFSGQSSPSFTSEPPSPLSSTPSPTTPTTSYAADPHLHLPDSWSNISLQTATKRASTLRNRLVVAHTDWKSAALAMWEKGPFHADDDILDDKGLGVHVLTKQGPLCAEEDIPNEMESEMWALSRQLGMRYEAATHLWSALLEIEEAKWVGEVRDRRLRTLGFLEGVVACWESLVKHLSKILKDEAGGRKGWEIRDEVWEILNRWRRRRPRPVM